MSGPENFLEYSEMMRAEALKPADCPSCGGYWFQDLDESGQPYTCFCCGNGSIRYLAYEVDTTGTLRRAGHSGEERLIMHCNNVEVTVRGADTSPGSSPT